MNKLAIYLKNRNETVNAFAVRTGLCQPTLWRIINNKHIPRPSTAKKIELATNCFVSRLDLLYPEKE